MVRNFAQATIGLLVLGVVLATAKSWGTDPLPPPPVVSAKSAAKSAALPTQLAYLGVGSCASTACHGGPASLPLKWQSSYTVWATLDPHAKAYAVLTNPRSKEIVQRLDGNDHPEPWKVERCLACHAVQDGKGAQAKAWLADGVSCEACHGPARNWLREHTTAGWTKLAKNEKYQARFGMRNTEDMLPRARQCVSCHVGELNPNGDVPRNVNHDLIAAGHPRLTFELSAYLANMPSHWDRIAGEKTNAEARAWAVGQVAGAEATFALREAHAAKSDGIEFADYDCYACHHDLKAEKWRKDQFEARRGHATPGDLRLSTWYTGMLPRLEAMAKVKLMPPTDSRFAGAVKGLEAWIQTQDAAALRSTMAHIARMGTDAAHWEDATQYYLALLALDNAHRDYLKSRAHPPAKLDAEIRQSLASIYRGLRFLKICQDQDGNVTIDPDCKPPLTEVSKMDSPRDYDPDRFRAELKKLTALLTNDSQ